MQFGKTLGQGAGGDGAGGDAGIAGAEVWPIGELPRLETAGDAGGGGAGVPFSGGGAGVPVEAGTRGVEVSAVTSGGGAGVLFSGGGGGAPVDAGTAGVEVSPVGELPVFETGGDAGGEDPGVLVAGGRGAGVLVEAGGGGTHWVHTVDVLVISTVEIVDVVSTEVMLPLLIVFVTGQVVRVVKMLERY